MGLWCAQVAYRTTISLSDALFFANVFEVSWIIYNANDAKKYFPHYRTKYYFPWASSHQEYVLLALSSRELRTLARFQSSYKSFQVNRKHAQVNRYILHLLNKVLIPLHHNTSKYCMFK